MTRNRMFKKRWLKLILCFGLSLTLALASGSMFLLPSYGQLPLYARSSRQLPLERGMRLYRLERFSESVIIWQQALEDYRVSGDILNEAMVWSYLSLAYQKLGQWEQAESAVGESLNLLPNEQNSSGEKLAILARAYNVRGKLHLALGRPQEALADWERASETYEMAGDEEGKFGSLINQAKALGALGFYRQALKTLLQVEEDIHKQSSPQLQVKRLLALGEGLQAIGDLEKSWQILNASLKIAEQYRLESLGEIYLSLGNTARLLAATAEDLDDAKTAGQMRDRALDCYEKAARSASGASGSAAGQVGAGPPIAALQANLNRLRLLLAMQDWPVARQLAREIRPVLQELPPSQTAIAAKINFAESIARFKKAREARGTIPATEIVKLLEKAIAEARTLQASYMEVYALGQLGRWYEVAEQWPQARDYSQQALELARELKAPEIVYLWEWQLARLQEKSGNKQEAIATYQRSLQALEAIPQNLAGVHKNLFAPNSGQALSSDIQFYFRERVEPVYLQFVDLLLQNPEPSQENLQQARDAIQQLQIAQLEQFLQCNLQDDKSQKLDAVVDREGSREAVIYPIILGDRIEVILKLDGQPDLLHHAEPIKRERVEETLKQLNQKLRGGKLASYKPAESLSKSLYQWLIQPFEKELAGAGVSTLVFVLDASWQNIPMSVLYDGDRYLLEKYAIAVTPPGLELRTPQPLEAAALKALLGGLSESPESENLRELPKVREQFEAIRSKIPSQVLLDRDFNRVALQEQIDFSSFPVVHLATHGQFGSRADRTFIVTWDSEPIDLNDLTHLLRGRQENRSEPIELLVLSACETASGDKRSALGLAGVALQSGARSTLATLWKIPADRSSVELFDRFYQVLQQNPTASKAEALRQAQLQLLADEQWKFPYFWAAYVMFGNWL